MTTDGPRRDPARPAARLSDLVLPDFGRPIVTPELAFAARFPEAWSRIQARRRFMADGLGIDLHPDVLPFSNIPAYLPPFILRPDRAMAVAR